MFGTFRGTNLRLLDTQALAVRTTFQLREDSQALANCGHGQWATDNPQPENDEGTEMNETLNPQDSKPLNLGQSPLYQLSLIGLQSGGTFIPIKDC